MWTERQQKKTVAKERVKMEKKEQAKENLVIKGPVFYKQDKPMTYVEMIKTKEISNQQSSSHSRGC